MARKNARSIKPHRLEDLLTEEWVRERSGDVFWERGMEYVRRRRVKDLTQGERDITATVIGTRAYQVTLAVTPNGKIAYDCTCPAWDSYGFCKHLVAVAVSWIYDDGVVRREGGRKLDEALAEAAGAYLATLPVAELAGLVAGRIAADEAFRTEMIFRLAGADPVIARQARTVIIKGVRAARPTPYNMNTATLSALQPLFSRFPSFVTESNASDMIDLSETAMAAAMLVYGRSESPEVLVERAGPLRRAHRTACDLARLTGRKRKEREAAFDRFCPELPPDDKTRKPSGRATSRATKRSAPPAPWRRDRMALELLGIDPMEWYDIEYCRALASWHLADPHLLVRARMARGEFREAITQTVKLLGRWPNDEATRRALTEAIAEAGDAVEGVLSGLWKQFAASFSTTTWETIRLVATHGDILETCRARALEMIDNERGKRRPHYGASGALIVAIHLSCNDPVAAWNAALEYDCSTWEWLRIADALVDVAPDDAAAIWQERVESEIERKTAQAYDEALSLLRKVENAMAAAGRDPDFTEYLGALLDANKKKKAFCGKLRAGWPERCERAERGGVRERREE